MMYRYETHLHTWPVSRCAKASVRDNLEFYKSLCYAGVFVTNHFINGNINISRDTPYRDKIEFYFSDYEEACRIGEEIGLRVFDGVEMSYGGTDFLIYGLHKDWYLGHPEIESLKMTELLRFLREQGALVIQAHPYREASYIDHIRLFPRSVHGVEICNADSSELENQMAYHYSNSYGLLHFAGTDNHKADRCKRFAGMESETPVLNEQDFVQKVLAGQMLPFCRDLESETERMSL